MRFALRRNTLRVSCKEQSIVHRKPKRQSMILPKQIPTLTFAAKSWAYLNGLVMLNSNKTGVIHAPITLTPSPFPKHSFEQAKEIMPIMNELYHAVSNDYDFLMNALKPIAEFDDFTANLLKIYSEVHQLQNGVEALELGIHRSDYMLDHSSGRLLQIELNTIASSFGALSCQVSKLHKFILSQIKDSVSDCLSVLYCLYSKMMKNASRVVDNDAAEGIIGALAQAHTVRDLPDSQILLIAEQDDGNLYDQQFLVVGLQEQYEIPMIRKSLLAIMDCAKLDENGNLLVDGQRISVVYYRSGYSPSSYLTEKEWAARRLIEISSACKCPSISYHLTGTKKIQQELAKPGNVERFLSAEDSQIVRGFFAGLWGLDDLNDSETKRVIEEAVARPDAFVLKPQREGGGNNLYGEQMVETLSNKQSLAAYILMERIRPRVHRTVLLRNEEFFEEETVSELGIYGLYLRKGSNTLLNKSAGHLLRTKVASSDEGGVFAGFATLDSPYLIDP
eukprot:g4028.t1